MDTCKIGRCCVAMTNKGSLLATTTANEVSAAPLRLLLSNLWTQDFVQK